MFGLVNLVGIIWSGRFIWTDLVGKISFGSLCLVGLLVEVVYFKHCQRTTDSGVDTIWRESKM